MLSATTPAMVLALLVIKSASAPPSGTAKVISANQISRRRGGGALSCLIAQSCWPLAPIGSRQTIIVDRGLVTSRKPADLPAFCKKMLEEFGEAAALSRERDAPSSSPLKD
jgi:hypothetical protein